MATITTEGVRHVANLARLEFNEEETEHFTEQLARILDYIGKLMSLRRMMCHRHRISIHIKFLSWVQKLGHLMSPSRMLSNPHIHARGTLECP